MDAEALATELGSIAPAGHLASGGLLREVAARWCEKQRYWHGPNHLLDLTKEICAVVTGQDRDVLLLAAIYHDAIYDPRGADNEEASALLLRDHAADPSSPAIQAAMDIIVASRWNCLPDSSLGRIFFDLDTRQLSDGCPLAERTAYEWAIFREYQWAPFPVYREKRGAFLQEWAKRYPQHRRGVEECLALLASLQPRIAIYPGSFHPFHLGHLSILRHAERAFDKVIVAVGVNRQKAGATTTLEERHAGLQKQLRYHEVAGFGGLLTGFLDELDYPAVVIRGVRDGTDLEAELRYARFLEDLRPGTGVIWISCDAQYQHLSSSAIRELAAIEPGAEERYVPQTKTIYGLVDRETRGARE